MTLLLIGLWLNLGFFGFLWINHNVESGISFDADDKHKWNTTDQRSWFLLISILIGPFALLGAYAQHNEHHSKK